MTSLDLPNLLDPLDMLDQLWQHFLPLPAMQYLLLDLVLDSLTSPLTYCWNFPLPFLYFAALLVSCCLP